MRLSLSAIVFALCAGLASAQGDVKDLVVKLKDKDSDVRRAAAKDLSELGAEAKAAVPALTTALGDKDVFVRRFSAEALGMIGPEAKSAIGKLSTLMLDERPEVQQSAVVAITKMGSAGVLALTNAVKDANKSLEVRRKAAKGLGDIGKEARGAVPALTDVLTGKIKSGEKAKKGMVNEDIKVEVAAALGKIATKSDTDAIAALKAITEAKQRNKALLQAAVVSLKQITGETVKVKKK
jgi:HEAT repeat protein